MNKQNRNRFMITEHFDGCQSGDGRGIGGIGEKGKGMKKYKLIATKYGDVKCCIGNIINNILITMYDARWVQDLSA